MRNKIVLLRFSVFLLAPFMIFDANGNNANYATGLSPQHTKESKKVLSILQKASRRKAPLFGHQDALMYGQNWWIDENNNLFDKSDVYDVCGKYPYVAGFDLGNIEKGRERNIDRCLFRQMKEAAIVHYRRGGLITFSWHMSNPVTNGNAWDCTQYNVVDRILNDPEIHRKFIEWLDKGAEFLNQLIDDKGRKIPVILRPFHECNMDGFWWSGKICTDEEFIKLWRLTFDYLVMQKGMTQLIWAYSPHDIKTEEEISSRYPGDSYVDIIGYERYQLGANNYEEGVERFREGASHGLDETIAFAQKHKKKIAFTETGFTGIPYNEWWTEALGKAIKGKKISYILVWRNGVSESYYFGPCPKSESVPNFNLFLKQNKVRLLSK